MCIASAFDSTFSCLCQVLEVEVVAVAVVVVAVVVSLDVLASSWPGCDEDVSNHFDGGQIRCVPVGAGDDGLLEVESGPKDPGRNEESK